MLRRPKTSLFERGRKRKGASPTAGLFVTAAVVGAAVGAASLTLTASGRVSIVNTANIIGVKLGVIRARSPQPGDYWNRCDEARAAGSTPIYDGEPGYREGLDGDGDGIACEPYRGM